MQTPIIVGILAIVCALIAFLLNEVNTALLLLGCAVLELLLTYDFKRKKDKGDYHPIHFEKGKEQKTKSDSVTDKA